MRTVSVREDFFDQYRSSGQFRSFDQYRSFGQDLSRVRMLGLAMGV